MVSTDSNPYAYVLWVHGGAFCFMNSHIYRPVTSHISMKSDVTVFLPNHRMPPEHPYPTPINDCLSVYKHLTNVLNIPPRKICLAGDSSGGNLAISMLMKMQEQNIPKPHGLLLNSPWLDLRFRGGSWETANDLLRGHECDQFVAFCAKSYAGDGRNIRDPWISPMFFSKDQLHAALPDFVLIQCGDDE